MSNYNLIEEPWIPCYLINGTYCKLGLRETFNRAKEIKKIYDSSPLITISIHRLLLVILHRNFGPSNLKIWKELWEQGKWDERKLELYFDQYYSKFFLFDEISPFYQVNDIGEGIIHPIARIAFEMASGNNATLFDHHFKSDNEKWELDQAARNLLAFQNYAIAGGVSKPFNFSDSTMTKGLAILLTGANLFETLMYNFVKYNQNVPFPSNSNDLPIWEQSENRFPLKEGTPVLGYLDYLTWQSRKIKLIADENDSSKVSGVIILQNLVVMKNLFDPMKAYKKSKESGLIPIRITTNRAVWRDAHAILQLNIDENHIRPKALDLIEELVAENHVSILKSTPSITAIGIGFGKTAAKIDLWSMEYLPFTVDYSHEEGLLVALEYNLSICNKIVSLFKPGSSKNKIKPPFRIIAQELLPATGESNEKEKEITKLVQSWGPEQLYWGKLNIPFQKMMLELSQDFVIDDGRKIYGVNIKSKWKDQLKIIAIEVFQQTITNFDTSSRILKGVALGEQEFHRQLHFTLNNEEEKTEETENDEEEENI